MLATQDVYSPSPDDLRRERLMQRRLVIDLQEVAFAREAADFAASDAWDEDGSVSAIDWMRFNCHMTAGAAANAVAVGESLERIPESHQAVVDGEIGFAHLAVMARTAEALGERFDEKVLVEKAKENSPGKFFYICHHARHAADPKSYAAEQAEQVQRRRLIHAGARVALLLIAVVISARPTRERRQLCQESGPAHRVELAADQQRAHFRSPPRRSSASRVTPASRVCCSTPNRW